MADYSGFQQLALQLISEYGATTTIKRPIQDSRVDPMTGQPLNSGNATFSGEVFVNSEIVGEAVFVNARSYEYQQGVIQRGDKMVLWVGPEPLIDDEIGDYRAMEVQRIAPDDAQTIMYKILVRK